MRALSESRVPSVVDPTGRELPSVDALVVTFNRPAEVVRAVRSCESRGFEEIIVLDNASDSPLRHTEMPPSVRLLRSETNLGACGGRNLLITSSEADLLLLLDDDAWLDSSTQVERLVQRFSDESDLAVIAGLVKRPSGMIVKHEFPCRRVRDIDQRRDVGYFLEGACLIRKSALDDVGSFDSSLFYGHESSDLSLRLIRKGWRVSYDPDLVVVHDPSPSGRKLTANTYVRQLRNRRILAWRNLPRPISYFHLSIWFVFYGMKVLTVSPRELPSLFKVMISALDEEVRTIPRNPIRLGEANKLQKTGYRIYW